MGRRTLISFALVSILACGKRPAPTHAAQVEAGAPEAAAPDATPPPPTWRTLATWPIEKDQSAFIAGVDGARTRAIVRVEGRSDARPVELLTVDWTAHTTTRVALRNLGQPKVDFADPETVRELAAYGVALGGARALGGRVSVAEDAIFVEQADGLHRTGLDGKDARLFVASANGAAVSPHGDAIAYVVPSGARVTRTAPPAVERRIDVANASSLTFSPDARTLYLSAGADRAKRCLMAANLVSGAVTKLACATIVEPMEILMAPNGKRAALFVSGGPSGIGPPEMIIVSLPDGVERSRKRLDWSMETYTALTDDGDVIGTTWTNQWGSPGDRIAVLAHDPAHPMGAALEGFTVESLALESGHTVLALATKRDAAGARVELAEVPLGP